MRNKGLKSVTDSSRVNLRIHTVDSISVKYEGKDEEIADRLPDVSPSGMFISTGQRFPVGAVLNLKFRLAISGAEIRTRCEVRYCQPGVGVGVEFIDISAENTRAIEREIEMCRRMQLRPKRAEKPSKRRRQKRHFNRQRAR